MARPHKSYALEDLREFVVRRSWFRMVIGDDGVITLAEYDALKARTLVLPPKRRLWLDGFRSGFLASGGRKW